MSDASEFLAKLPAELGGVEPIDRSAPGELTVSDLTTLDWDDDSGDHNGVRNTQRAGRALGALEAYADLMGGIASEPSEQMLRDLLCDLRHLADALGEDYADLDARGRGQYEVEAAGH
jgi:hypothetical protein